MLTAETKQLKLFSERLSLRILNVDDVTQEYVDGLNDVEVNRYLLTSREHAQTLESVRAYVQSNLSKPTDYLFGIFLKGHERLIGTIRLSDVSPHHFFGGVGICLFDKSQWQKGYALEALQALVRFAFDRLGLHYLEAGCYAENRGSVRLFEKAGFTIVARHENKYRHENRFVPVVFLGIYNTSFQRSLLE
jgi:[ribosomal protein S5]-alanine N-acetyltransferase